MRIRDFHPGDGEQLTKKARKGDTFFVMDGEHAKCKKPSMVQGISFQIDWDEDRVVYLHRPALLLRCTACFDSYTMASEAIEK